MKDGIKEILEHLKEYLQSKIDNGENKIFYNDLMWDEKTIDCINAIDEALNFITKLEEKIETEHKAYMGTVQELTETATRIDKAIEYIEEYCIDGEFYVNLTKKEKNIIKAYNILKGDDNSE